VIDRDGAADGQTVSARTRLAAVMGSPVAHSLSPAIHNAAFAATGADWVYVAFEVDEPGVGAAMAGVRALGIAGLSVTMPAKEAVARHVDERSSDADALGAVNCVAVRDGRLVGHNTDGAGFVDALQLDAGIGLDGLDAVVLGAGGAARAVVRALAGAGAARVTVVARNPDRGEVAARLAGEAGRVGAPVDVAGAAVVVNATPVGMGDDAGALPVDPTHLGAGQVVVDLIYHPRRTALLVAAEAAGATPVDGLGMLVHQAAHQFRIWTGLDAPLVAMRAAAERQLARET
jgi:shikimate dehydrogenase